MHWTESGSYALFKSVSVIVYTLYRQYIYLQNTLKQQTDEFYSSLSTLAQKRQLSAGK